MFTIGKKHFVGDRHFVLKPSTVGRSGVFSLEGKLYGLCMKTQYTYRHSFHPETYVRERPHDDILYYMTNLFVKQKIADDILKSVTVSTENRRERYGLMPISVYEFQKWVYSVADNVCATARWSTTKKNILEITTKRRTNA